MHQVADNQDTQLAEVGFVLPDSESIEQSLCGVRYMRFTGVENADMRRNERCDLSRQSRLCIAHHQHIGMHGLQRVKRVQHGFTFHAR